ncbi:MULTISPECIES: cytochrome ubiquinol oxidase subunit I [Staphylococcus]|jgi:cytochrome d ubiquinol oxidase subunit I|uniref:cytochrome ubiquinol oxidase subunit I n=1 Tax=Staphylococcus TaxID=1279 RepID=UPI000E07EA28|nr:MULTISPECIES: cytochrome ubiquinol oxidase subunit I [Staphylococcus]MBO1204602.1 cytochrome ubiquinol oxidase subunit I [Staphylococcus nepalensis]MDR5648485.1 cytochrome ubiquinol oxidase subunit I [Staphylococcus nepalensis]MDW8551288.1 cytochrome ubiquinol oxidase subunit I [Staphylococcus nepalensis]RIO41340.1 cytochrome ubiquinol oxidase subunit I [Staphylococcus nepalensis]WQL19404.1 cytochrome ubiquinol oxidase subunit I [Staphylococcus nepalensis]
MDSVELARFLTAMTLAVHIIFATIGVGVPLMFAIAEFLGIKKNDPHYITLAKRWSKGYTITVAVGVVTGTIIGLQLSLLWPTFMQMGGHVIALPLFMETFAFFFEAIFLSIYLYTWDRFKSKWTHFLISIPVIIGGSFSAFFITAVNSFMNTPAGFEMSKGKMINVEPWVAMFNDSFFVRSFHVVATAFMTMAFVLAAIAAFKLMKNKFKKDTEYHKKALKLTMILGIVFTLGSMLAGDLSAKFLHQEQPEKLAAYEWHFDTESNANLVLFGTLDEETQEVSGAIKLPSILSFLADNNVNTEVKGLNDFPEELHPPMIVHYYFDLMVSMGVFCLIISAAFILTLCFKKLRRFTYSKPMLYGALLTGPAAMLAIEFGWFLTEQGRQPWIVRGYLKVADAATQAGGITLVTVLFGILYLILIVTSSYVLLRMFKNKPAYKEFEEHSSERGDA